MECPGQGDAEETYSRSTAPREAFWFSVADTAQFFLNPYFSKKMTYHSPVSRDMIEAE
jgi:hypothetical protein